MSEALVIIDYRKFKTNTIYTQPSKQIQVMKQLVFDAIEMKKTSKDLSSLHGKLEEFIQNDNYQHYSESDNESDDECQYCGHSDHCCKAENRQQWSHKERVLRCKEIIKCLEDLKPSIHSWLKLADDCELDYELNDKVKFYFAQINTEASD